MDVAASSSEQRGGVRRWLLSLCLFLLSTPCFAQPETPISLAEQRAKAVTQVVLGILSYARWPIEPAQLQLCVVGPTEYTDDLLKGATQSSGRQVFVRRLLVNNPTIADDCNALYLGKLSDEERSSLFNALTGHAVLSISEGGDQCTVGTLFCLRVADEQVSFEVNLDSVARSGVRIHPSVLQLSRRRAAQP
ncbi:YfiR family protein [Pseudomonas weihenstephanensis]|uniref:YfiR family protein n=1 Tax=Pseudomonas weihenstephanensis TaxID=1608994 RepID=A0ABS1ZLR4_9PSED|nr:YfiR family protein [Pseudomonas weihenstephanensis]MBM1197302.1 YfiR family protein [Pseudomonas weihenstephanensis]